MALSLLKAWFHNYMLAYAQSAGSDNIINQNQKDGNCVMGHQIYINEKNDK